MPFVTFVLVLIIILVLIFLGHKTFFSESFVNNNTDSLKLYVFTSPDCPHCHTYLTTHHNDIMALCESKGIGIDHIVSDNSTKSNELFAKYNVQFIPSGIIIKGDNVYKNLGSDITPQSVKTELNL